VKRGQESVGNWGLGADWKGFFGRCRFCVILVDAFVSNLFLPLFFALYFSVILLITTLLPFSFLRALSPTLRKCVCGHDIVECVIYLE